MTVSAKFFTDKYSPNIILLAGMPLDSAHVDLMHHLPGVHVILLFCHQTLQGEASQRSSLRLLPELCGRLDVIVEGKLRVS